MARYIHAGDLARILCNYEAIDEHSANAVINLLYRMPTADVAEVVHAEWVECSNELNKYCSNCTKIHGDIYYKPPFCENCGAKMDE